MSGLFGSRSPRITEEGDRVWRSPSAGNLPSPCFRGNGPAGPAVLLAMDHRIVFIAVGVALVAVICYLLVMRIFYRESAEADKSIDYSKMKEWKDDD